MDHTGYQIQSKTNSHTEPLHALHSKVVSLTFTTVVVALVGSLSNHDERDDDDISNRGGSGTRTSFLARKLNLSSCSRTTTTWELLFILASSVKQVASFRDVQNLPSS